MDNQPSPAATHTAANPAAIHVHVCYLSVNNSPPLPVLRDRHINRIIEGIHSQQIQYEQWHPPQFYPNTTTPCIVTQSDLEDSEAAALLTML